MTKKRIWIKRKGAPAICAEEVAPHTFRLTCCGKPYNMADRMMEACYNEELDNE